MNQFYIAKAENGVLIKEEIKDINQFWNENTLVRTPIGGGKKWFRPVMEYCGPGKWSDGKWYYSTPQAIKLRKIESLKEARARKGISGFRKMVALNNSNLGQIKSKPDYDKKEKQPDLFNEFFEDLQELKKSEKRNLSEDIKLESHKAIRILSIHQDKSVAELLEEAINLVVQKYITLS